MSWSLYIFICPEHLWFSLLRKLTFLPRQKSCSAWRCEVGICIGQYYFFPLLWRFSFTVLIAFCFCEFLRLEALVQASPVSGNLVVPRSKPNSLASACCHASLQICLSLDGVSVFHPSILKAHSVFTATCPGLGEQPGTFDFPHLSVLLKVMAHVSPLHRCRN